jgi:hypothetical protein
VSAPGALALAYAFSSVAGLRSALTLLLAGLAIHFGYLHPNPQFRWLGEEEALWVLGLAALVEICADKVPVLDHAVHAVQFAAKPVAGAIIAGGLAPSGGGPGDELVTAALMAAGGANALAFHTASATARAGSTAFSGGLLNPALSLVEDILTIAGVLVALVAPYFGALTALVLFLFLARLTLSRLPKKKVP